MTVTSNDYREEVKDNDDNHVIDMAGVSNAGEEAIAAGRPYRVELTIVGEAPILFHRWQSDAVEAKARAPKNSLAKKTDEIENYVYRTPSGTLGLPGVYLIGSLTDSRRGAAKFRQDPRSPRKSALDLYRAAVLPLTELADLGCKRWDYEDRQRAVVQNSAITRTRPGLYPGWKATFRLLVTMPEYVPPTDLYDCLAFAGRSVGVGDFRPTYGRFQVRAFEVLKD